MAGVYAVTATRKVKATGTPASIEDVAYVNALLIPSKEGTRRMSTDTARLAAAITAIEAEFPTLRWGVGKTTGAFVYGDFNIEASSFTSCPAVALDECAAQLREHAARSRVAAEHARLMDAEYGPEVRR